MHKCAEKLHKNAKRCKISAKKCKKVHRSAKKCYFCARHFTKCKTGALKCKKCMSLHQSKRKCTKLFQFWPFKNLGRWFTYRSAHRNCVKFKYIPIQGVVSSIARPNKCVLERKNKQRKNDHCNFCNFCDVLHCTLYQHNDCKNAEKFDVIWLLLK